MRLSTDLRREAFAHIDALAAEHQIEVRYGTAVGPYADRHARLVWSPWPYSPLGYMVALHELGHIVTPGADPIDQGELVTEALAWEWAAEKALPSISAKLSARDTAAIGGMLVSYLRLSQKQEPSWQV